MGGRLRAQKKAIRSDRNVKVVTVVLLFIALLVFGQQCSNVPLENLKEYNLFSTGPNPFRLGIPNEVPIIRRIVFFVDMSNSMISGPCPQDVNASAYSTDPAAYQFDPNKGGQTAGDPYTYYSDYRLSGIDCVVDPSLPLGVLDNSRPNLNLGEFFKTFKGTDWNRSRLQMIRDWLNEMRNSRDAAAIQNTQVLIYPFTGGASQVAIEAAIAQKAGSPVSMKFVPLNDPSVDRLVLALEQEHDLNKSLVQSSDEERSYKTTMGPSSPGSLLKSLYNTIASDMRGLNQAGSLPYAEYTYVHLSDGLINPTSSKTDLQSTPFYRILYQYPTCRACAANPATCTQGSSCQSLIEKMKVAWGNPEDNLIENMDFYYGLIQSLPASFGAGHVQLNFVQIDKDAVDQSLSVDQPMYDRLKALFKTRNAVFHYFEAKNGSIPFSLASTGSQLAQYKVTNVNVLNLNARIDQTGKLRADSDADGLWDDLEAAQQKDRLISRTDGICLDGISANPAYTDRCKAMLDSKSCDPTLDSDGDGLNECEEAILGTDPFDFDTDGDGIPDYIEVLYGFNPKVPDLAVDSNGDGVLNSISYAKGVGPQIELSKVDDANTLQIEVNSREKEKIYDQFMGPVWMDLYEVIVKRFPLLQLGSAQFERQSSLFLTRNLGAQYAAARDLNRIDYDHSLITYAEPQTNTLLAIVRIIEKNNPDRAYWRIYKQSIPIGKRIVFGTLDLSQFKQIQAVDRSQ